MITINNIKKNASVVLLNTVETLYDNDEQLIENFYEDFVKEHKNNKKLKKNINDNEILDELILEELEKSFTQNDIGHALNTEMIKENDKAVAELSHILEEKLRPVSQELRSNFKNEEEYTKFKNYTTEHLVVNNLNLTNAVIRSLKVMGISGMQSIQIMQLINRIDN